MSRQYAFGYPWEEFHTERFFCLTADQDWAPDWATAFMIDWARSLSVPLHVFQTSASAALSGSAESGELTLGWHPNFGSGSTHGSNTQAVVDHMSAAFPGATSFRSHAFSESFDALVELSAAGIIVDSQYPTAFSSHITPSVHAAGIVRLPVWFEDDIWMRVVGDTEQPLESALPSLDTPGLKILNVHPVHIALNSPHASYYEERREAIYSSPDDIDPRGRLEFDGRGVRDVVEDIIALAERDGETFIAFDALAQRALRASAENSLSDGIRSLARGRPPAAVDTSDAR